MIDNSADEIVTPIITSTATGHEDDLGPDDQRWIETVTASLEGRSTAAREALAKALLDGEGSVPLLALIPSRFDDGSRTRTILIENKQENGVEPNLRDQAYSDRASLAPLLGTSTSQVLEISRGSSQKRSPESICYPKLLRENGLLSARTPHKTVRGE